MAKTISEQMMKQILRQNAALTKLLTEQQKQLSLYHAQMGACSQSKDKEDEPSLFNDNEPPKTDAERREEERLEIMTLLGQMQEEAHESMPTFSELSQENDIDNLKAFSEGMFCHLLRSHFGNAAVEGYKHKYFDPQLFRHIVRYFDRLGDEGVLPISDEDRSAAAHEEELLEAERTAARAARMSSGKGRFTLCGREDLETFFNEQVVDIVEHLDDYKAMGISFPRPFILEGPPGCGKTYAVERLAEHLNWKTYRITSGTIGSTYVHGTAKKVEQIFKEAEENAPALLIIDEMDAFMPNRAISDSGSNDHHIEEVDCFLKCLQTAAEKQILVVGMTNLLRTIDPAILRTGRMGTHIHVGMPSLSEVKIVLQQAVDKRPHAEDLAVDSIAEQLLNHPLSDVTYVADEAAMTAVRAKRKSLTQSDLETALNRLRSHTRQEEHRTLGFCA